MNEKLNMQDLIDLLTYKYNIPKKNVELFVKEFFDLVVYALENDKYLKIKGFGTFKLILKKKVPMLLLSLMMIFHMKLNKND